jgi:hypothetical protein
VHFVVASAADNVAHAVASIEMFIASIPFEHVILSRVIQAIVVAFTININHCVRLLISIAWTGQFNWDLLRNTPRFRDDFIANSIYLFYT